MFDFLTNPSFETQYYTFMTILSIVGLGTIVLLGLTVREFLSVRRWKESLPSQFAFEEEPDNETDEDIVVSGVTQPRKRFNFAIEEDMPKPRRRK